MITYNFLAQYVYLLNKKNSNNNQKTNLNLFEMKPHS